MSAGSALSSISSVELKRSCGHRATILLTGHESSGTQCCGVVGVFILRIARDTRSWASRKRLCLEQAKRTLLLGCVDPRHISVEC